jgi:hypothetical protein
MLKRLHSAGEEVAKNESSLFRAKLHRDREMQIATELGLSRRDVADAVGLTPGGVQHIVTSP